MIRITEGSLLDEELNVNTDIIAHQVNCLGVMGGGVALQIARKWPFVAAAYKKYLSENPEALGTVHCVDEKDGIIIANLFGQVDVGPGLQTDYDALFKAVDELIAYAVEEGYTHIAMPWKIGCGLAGGDWDIVKPAIEKKFNRLDVHLEWRLIH